MPAIAVCQQHFQWLACRLRGQARSHIFGPWRLWRSDSSWIWMPIAPEPMTGMDFTGVALTPVGAGLLANAVGQSNHQRLTRRLRGQARSHIFGPWPLVPGDFLRIWMPTAPTPMTGMDFTGVALTPVGAGLPANAVGQSNHQWLTRRLRGQARSHIFGPWPL